jgi:hypothetical protein
MKISIINLHSGRLIARSPFHVLGFAAALTYLAFYARMNKAESCQFRVACHGIAVLVLSIGVGGLVFAIQV